MHQLANALDGFFYAQKKAQGESLNSFITRFRNGRTRLRGLGVELPPCVDGYMFMRQLGISPEQRQSILSLAAGSYDLDPLVRASQTLLQEVSSSAAAPPPRRFPTSSSHRDRDRRPEKRAPYYRPNSRFRRQYPAEVDLDSYQEVDEQNYPYEDYEEAESDELAPDESPSGTESSEASEIQAFLAFRAAKKFQRDQKVRRGFSKTPHPGASSGSRDRPRPAPSPQRLAEIQALKKTTRCKSCGQIGHWQKECPKQGNSNSHHDSTPTRRQYMVEAYPSAFVLTAPQDESVATCLVDTGCNQTVIALEWFRRHQSYLGLVQKASTHKTVFRFGPGPPLETCGVCVMQVSVGDSPGCALVIERPLLDAEVPCLLGRDILAQLDTTLSLKPDAYTAVFHALNSGVVPLIEKEGHIFLEIKPSPLTGPIYQANGATRSAASPGRRRGSG